jgi:hypothetical protein
MKFTYFLARALRALLTTPKRAINRHIDNVENVSCQSAPSPATSKGSETNLQKTALAPVISPADAEELKRIHKPTGAIALMLRNAMNASRT